MARYIVSANKIERMGFLELVLARRYARTLAPGTGVKITDTEAGPGHPGTDVMTAGESGLVKGTPSLKQPSGRP